MRILAINQFYAPDHAATSQLLTELCEDLVARGDEVTVIASRGSYLGGGRLPARETLRGVQVVRPLATSFGKGSVAARLSDYLSFWATAVGRAAIEARPDVVLAVTTPPMIASGAALVAAARGLPLVSWVQDVYPDVAVAFGVLREGHPAARALALLQRGTYRAASRVVAISDGMADRLAAQGAPRDRLRVIPNWADGATLTPIDHAENPFRREHGLDGRFVAMYSGNLGVGHDVATFVGAARALEARRPEVLFLFIGDGARRAEAESLARGLGNVRFLPYQPYATLRQSLAAADVHLISLREGLDGLLVPSKLYGALAMGRPIFYVGPEACEVTRVIRRHDLGWAGRPGDVEGLARAIASAAASPAWRAERGARARAVFERELDRPIAVARWRAVLAEAAEGRPSRWSSELPGGSSVGP